MDEDGFVAITGRIKDIINRGGVKFNPQDIENLLSAHPAVQMAAVAPVPHDVLGEQACAWVPAQPRRRNAGPGDAVRLPDGNTGSPATSCRRSWQSSRSFPMTPTRKIIKGELKTAGGVGSFEAGGMVGAAGIEPATPTMST